MAKLSLILIFGGRSGEHEVSVLSATSIAANLDPAKYDVVPVRIAKNGSWSVDPSILPKARRGAYKKGVRRFVPDPTVKHLLDEKGNKAERIDIVFPIVHGTFGEDGSLQGLLEMAEVPYVGSGVLGSAVGMDKIVAKKLLKAAGLPVVPWMEFDRAMWERDRKGITERVGQRLDFPCFVKPVNMGSSVGVGKAHHRKEFGACMDDAFTYDDRVLVEHCVHKVREIECAVIGDASDARPSALGEIFTKNEFLDYEAKYTAGGSHIKIPADLPKQTASKIADIAVRAFSALRAHGMARVDCFLSAETREIYVNEINTLPGFTAVSHYPKMQAEAGLAFPALLDRLIELAKARRKAQGTLSRSYRP